MSRISLDQVPPGGWSYEQDGFRFEEPTFAQLFHTVHSHREANGKPEGNPFQEIQDQICAKHTETCLDVKPSPVVPPPPPTTFLENLRSFAQAGKNFIMAGGALVDQNTANSQALICIPCHNNVPAGEARRAPGGCGKCGAAVQAGIDSVRGIVLAGRKTPHDEKMQACLLCGCDLKLKVWFPVKYFDPDCSKCNQWPDFCWMKQCP